MAEMLIQSENLVAIANKIRVLSGIEDDMSLDAMETRVGEANASIDAVLSAIADRGVQIPEGANVGSIVSLIGDIGVELPELINPVSAEKVIHGYEYINQDGEQEVGTMTNNGAIAKTMDGINTKSVTIPAGYTSGGSVSLDNTIDNEVDIQAELITQITSALEGKTAGGEQITPEISINQINGLITATAGAKTSTYQLAFQGAKTITPSTNTQIAVPAGYYTGGDITVNGDNKLVADNIKSGVSIFGVKGNYTGDNNWIEISSLPQTYGFDGNGGGNSASTTTYTYYYEIPNNCVGIIFYSGNDTDVNSCQVSFIYLKGSESLTNTCSLSDGYYGNRLDVSICNGGLFLQLTVTSTLGLANSFCLMEIY